mmetsp:Transcript_14480/g.32900  ORF Transcript_14480/g.32900 Transcript_14480/m.32900 type:complete len:99 (+) Transcript_14480:120-416(+)
MLGSRFSVLSRRSLNLKTASRSLYRRHTLLFFMAQSRACGPSGPWHRVQQAGNLPNLVQPQPFRHAKAETAVRADAAPAAEQTPDAEHTPDASACACC